MRNHLLADAAETGSDFGRNFLIVLGAHLFLAVAVWLVALFFFKPPAVESITWLDGGGELAGAAASAAAPGQPTPEAGKSEPAVPPEEPPPEPAALPAAPSEMPLVEKEKPAPVPIATPRPRPATPRPTPAKKAMPTPAVQKSTSKAPEPKKKQASRAVPAKLATPRPGANAAAPKISDSKSRMVGATAGKADAGQGSGDAAAAGTKGGPGAAGGSDAVLLGYFKKIEMQFHREWEQPLTVERTGRSVEAYVRLRAAPDGTVESLKLVKPTGNNEVDHSIEEALRRVTKVERPPASLLKNGVLDEMVAFILEL
jgi:outer membrane biosynthesis protein TonB